MADQGNGMVASREVSAISFQVKPRRQNRSGLSKTSWKKRKAEAVSQRRRGERSETQMLRTSRDLDTLQLTAGGVLKNGPG